MDFPGFHGSDKQHVQYHNALLSQFLAGFIGQDIQGSVVRVIEGAGHLPQIEQPAAFLNDVLPFLINEAPFAHADDDFEDKPE